MTTYDPHKHHRSSIRLKGYDYSKAGLYFVTICCEDRKHRFGNVKNGKMQLNELGKIAFDEWVKLTERFSNFELDVFQIMPDHMHGIISLITPVLTTVAVVPNNLVTTNDTVPPYVGTTLAVVHNNTVPPNDTVPPYVGTTLAVVPNNTVPTNNGIRTGASPVPTVSDIVGAYKSLVANGCLHICKSKNEMMGKLWQRNYHEHIIRNEQSYQNISKYIINNPAKWAENKFYSPKNSPKKN